MLETFFSPKSVAVVGASTDRKKLGYIVLNNAVQAGYKGNLYPINPKADQILGYKAYPSLADLPETPDLAVIVIPYPGVPAIMEECGKKGIPAAVVISAGFREAGYEGMQREVEMLDIAKRYNIRVIGPNCLGIIDCFTPLNVTFAAGTPPNGPIAFMSQSGALGTAILDWAMAGKQIGFSKFVSLGNKADISEIELMQAWADDPNTRVILAYSEGLPNGAEFMRVAREVSRKKPIVMVKSGTTTAGSRAVSSHTGSLAGSEQAYNAAFRQSGVLRAESLQDLFDYALGLAYQPLLGGDQIAIVTNAGGPGILCTDALERANLQLARFEPETTQKLLEFLPDAASAANPVDVLGDALADRYVYALEHVANDPNVDGIIVIVTPQAMTEIEATARAIGECSRRLQASGKNKPVIGCMMGEFKVAAAIELLAAEYNVPNYPFPERAARAFAAMRDYRVLKDAPSSHVERMPADNAAVKSILETVRADGRVSIGDSESRDILSAYGLRIPRAKLAATADEAVTIAGQIGYPVVLKIASPDILHKTDVGGVKVGLNSANDVRDAFDLIVYRAQRYVPGATIWGCLVQEMIPKGTEILVGMNRDPQFGPLVTFGMGGIYVEVLKDVTFRIAPFDRLAAEQMLSEIRARALLEGVRGQNPADTAAIVETLMKISQLVTDFPEIIEMDINPLMVYAEGHGAIALDARLVLSSETPTFAAHH
ncbi:MAG: acetate--CoA ligase [Anaerolineae bacterium]